MTLSNPFQQMGAMPMPTPQLMMLQLPIDPVKFKQGLARMDQNTLNQLVLLARLLGLSEKDILAGLQYIQNMR